MGDLIQFVPRPNSKLQPLEQHAIELAAMLGEMTGFNVAYVLDAVPGEFNAVCAPFVPTDDCA